MAQSKVDTHQRIAELGTANARGIDVAQGIPAPWAGAFQVVRDYRKDLARRGGAALSYDGLEGTIDARLVVAALERSGLAPTREVRRGLHAGPFDLGGDNLKFPHGNEGSSYVEISIIGTDGMIIN